MYSSIPPTPSLFKRFDRNMIEPYLLSMYAGESFSKRLYYKKLIGLLVPDFYTQHPEGRMRTIVEIGCGTGLFANYLSLLLPNTQVIAIDSDPNNIFAAKSTIGRRENIHFICGDAFRLSPLQCDRLILSEQFSAIGEQAHYQKLIRRSFDWLSRTGDLLIREKSPHSPINGRFWRALAHKEEGTLVLHEWLQGMLIEAGYPHVEKLNHFERFESAASRLLSPYLHYRAPRTMTASAPKKIQPQAKPVAKPRTAASPHLFDDNSTDAALNLIFANRPESFALDLG